jgi:hypothetical protein
MSSANSSDSQIKYAITAISPIFASISIISLFLPWVSGKLLVIGKTITAFDFPNVFWSVLIGSLALIVVYIRSILASETTQRRAAILALASVTLIAAGYFLYGYSKSPSIPGVRVSFHGGLLLCFASLILSVIGAVIPLNLFKSPKSAKPADNNKQSTQNRLEIPPTQ